MASKKKSSGSGHRKAARATSNVFALFDQTQIQEFKEAFQFIDSNKDGFIDKEDLRATFDSLGKILSESDLDGMIAEAPGPINFTTFLTIFGERISGADPEDVIMGAFRSFDMTNSGRITEKVLKSALTTGGDRLLPDEVEQAFGDAPIDREGLLDYQAYTRLITRGKEEEEGEEGASA